MPEPDRVQSPAEPSDLEDCSELPALGAALSALDPEPVPLEPFVPEEADELERESVT